MPASGISRWSNKPISCSTQVTAKAGSTVSDSSLNFIVREGVDFYAKQNYLAIQELELKVQGAGVIVGFQSFSVLAERGGRNLRYYYRMVGNFCGVLIFVIFVVDPE